MQPLKEMMTRRRTPMQEQTPSHAILCIVHESIVTLKMITTRRTQMRELTPNQTMLYVVDEAIESRLLAKSNIQRIAPPMSIQVHLVQTIPSQIMIPIPHPLEYAYDCIAYRTLTNKSLYILLTDVNLVDLDPTLAMLNWAAWLKIWIWRQVNSSGACLSFTLVMCYLMCQQTSFYVDGVHPIGLPFLQGKLQETKMHHHRWHSYIVHGELSRWPWQVFRTSQALSSRVWSWVFLKQVNNEHIKSDSSLLMPYVLYRLLPWCPVCKLVHFHYIHFTDACCF